MENEALKICGNIEEIIYSNDENGYTICDVATGDGDLVTVVGYLPYICEGDSITVYGKWVHNPKYGRQFAADSFEKTLPADKASMLRYLSSRAIRGIGPKTARKIMDEFGEDSFEVIENHPEWLARLPGLSMNKAMEISEDFKNKAGMRQAMIFFRDWFGSASTVKIFKKWGSRSVELAKENPYILCEYIDGIGFESSDKMAKSLGLDNDSKERVEAGVVYTLSRNERMNGHVCLPREKLVAAASALLSVAPEKAEEAITELLKADKLRYSLFDDQKYIYIKETYEEENYIAKKLVKLDLMCPKTDIDDAERLIDKAETDNGIEYAALQRKAIEYALVNGVSVITGGPGTGKTTVIKALLHIFTNTGGETVLAAPTGRAAKRMSESTSREAKTVHRLLGMGFDDDDNGSTRFSHDEDDPIDADTVIIDEASMIDNYLMYSLLKALRPGTRLILIGDADQLPSVGSGNILRDIVNSKRFVTVSLTEIFRQAQKSLIVTNAHAVNNGRMPDLKVKDNDFFFVTRDHDRDAAATIADLYANRLPKAYGKDIINSIQVIAPSRRGEAGTENLNVLLQSVLNPSSNSKKEHKHREFTFREGDRVMQTRNNYEIEWTADYDKKKGTGVFNGDIGVIESIERSYMVIRFDDRTVEYDYELLSDLEPAYAITVHKSQGSEYQTVIIPVCTAPPMLLTRNMLYTAITRAQKRVILVGREATVSEMVKNRSQSLRYTGLYFRLREHE